MTKIKSDLIGIIAIGRNEGTRLRRCLESISFGKDIVVYVDSGSSDGSINIAQEFGAHVVDLDMEMPFTAARARNSGFEKLIKISPDVKFIQFIEGDCELQPDWLRVASEMLAQMPDVAIVAGHLSEKYPSHSIYNRLAELEWNFYGFGEVDAVGGIFMIRRSAFEQSGGFDPTVAAGEEPELCQRLRASGWTIIRVGLKMACHDLAMSRFSQWWNRQGRCGYGGLDVVTRFGVPGFKKNIYLARFWTLWLFITTAAVIANAFYDLSVDIKLFSGLLIFIWPLQLARIALREKMHGTSFVMSWVYAWFTMFSFWAQMAGQFRYLLEVRKKKMPN